MTDLRERGAAGARADGEADYRPKSIAAGGLYGLVFRGLELVCLVLVTIVTGRLMEPAGRGLYAVASVAASLCTLPLGGVWIANSVELARRRATAGELLGVSLVIAAVGGLATANLALLFALGVLGDRWWLVGLPALVTPFMLLTRYQEGLYTGLGHVRAVSWIILGRAALPLLFITPPLLAGASSQATIAFWTLTWVTLPILTFFPLRRLVGPPQPPRDEGLYRRVIGYGGKLAAINAVGVLNDRVAIVALAVMATDADAGVYSIAVAGAQVLLVATQALRLSAFHRVSTESTEASAALTLRTIRHAVLLAAVGGLLMIPVVALAIPWTVGPGYEDVPRLLALLVPGAIAMAAMQPLYTFFNVRTQRPAVTLGAAGSGFAATIALTVALIPAWGASGAAAGTSLGTVIGAAVAFWFFRTQTAARVRELCPGPQELRDYAALASSLRARRRGQEA